MEHYKIDLLNEYATEKIPGTNRPEVNPLWRDQDSLVRSLQGKLKRQQCLFAAHTIRPETELDRYSEDDCVPRRDVDDADCARIISERR